MVSVKLPSEPLSRLYTLEYLESSSDSTAFAWPPTCLPRGSAWACLIGHIDLRISSGWPSSVPADVRHGIVCFGKDRFLDLDLQDQVSAAAQVQAKVNALGQALGQGLAGEPRRTPKMPYMQITSTATIRRILF